MATSAQMAPLERPSTRLFPRRDRSPSVERSLIANATGRSSSSAISTKLAICSRERFATGRLAGTEAASMCCQLQSAGGPRSRAPGRSGVRSGALALCLDRLVERQLSTLDGIGAVVRERGVAVLVDRVRAEHALAVLRGEDLLEDLRLVVRARALDGVDEQAHRLVAVDRVRIGVLLTVLGRELVEELLA